MPRQRNAENRGLPARWRKYHGAYYYQVPPGLESHWDGKKQFRLGTSLPEAYRIWAERVEAKETLRTVNDLLDRYAAEVIPTKAPSTQVGNSLQLVELRKRFGNMAIQAVKPRHVYEYIDKRRVKNAKPGAQAPKAKIAAHREVEVLSHAYTMAVKWGYIDRHPFKGEIELDGEKPRTRYVEDNEVIECLKLPSKRKAGSVLAIQAYIRLKLMTSMARGDLLRLTDSQMMEDGIHVQRHKTVSSTGKRTIYEWTPELRSAVALAKAVRPAKSDFLFCKRDGTGYVDESTGVAHGWDSMWQRFMDRVLKESSVAERFTEHDLRAKCASDAETLDHARALLAHADSRTTQAIYRRKPERVTPAAAFVMAGDESKGA